MVRKPVLLIDDAQESRRAIELFAQSGRPYVEYHIKKFEESCCGELPTTRAPSVFAPEGVFKGLEGVQEYLSLKKSSVADGGEEKEEKESESAYW
jgi:hypothetical protein